MLDINTYFKFNIRFGKVLDGIFNLTNTCQSFRVLGKNEIKIIPKKLSPCWADMIRLGPKLVGKSESSSRKLL